LTSLMRSHNLCVACSLLFRRLTPHADDNASVTVLEATFCPTARCRGSPLGPSRTSVSIQADQFFIDGRPTYEGRSYGGMKIEGLLMNARMAQGIFDDLTLNSGSLGASTPTARRHSLVC